LLLSVQPRKAVFLDRDGTVIRDLDYLGDPDKIEFLPGAVEALRSLHAQGYLLVVITNQSGVARGFFDEAACQEVGRRFKETLDAAGVPIAASYYCPHLPGAPVQEYDRVCDCRKPSKGLFEKAARELRIDFSSSWAVGDMLRDLEPAKNLGARTILVLTGKGREQAAEPQAAAIADFTATDLADAARIILSGVA
jgi:D-glycero-D-manno-heptose 1,7-bisphosphate phosphatase